MRISRWAAVPLLILTLVLGACSGGGDDAGGGSEASDGAKAAEEALADQEREAAEVLDQAKSDLDAAVQGLQACNPDVEQLRRVAQPLGVLQQFGADTDAITNNALTSQARVIQSIARAQAAGTIEGIPSETLVALARAAGLDPLADGWMSDPLCAVGWRIEMDWSQSFGAGGFAIGIDFSGHADFGASPGDAFQSNRGPMEIGLGLAMTGCTGTLLNSNTEGLSVAGKYENSTISGTATLGKSSYLLRMVCGDGTPLDIPSELSEFIMPFTLAAQDGATQTIPFPTMQGDVTFTLRVIAAP